MTNKDDSEIEPGILTLIRNLSVELRHEERYPCVGITLIYSPVQNAVVANLADSLSKATVLDMSLSGLAFEVDRELQKGGKLVVLIQRPEGKTSARMMSNVRWCKKLAPQHYRVGITIDGGEPVIPDAPERYISDPIGKTTVPHELNVLCPACKKLVDFTYIGEQPVLAGVGIMPLYNCSDCGTTRSLTGIVISQIKSSESKE